MSITTANALLDTLVKYRLVDAAQMGELSRVSKRAADPRALIKDMVQREWLTGYQATQILAGKASDLAIGSYVVLDLLGEGGSGQVFRARHQHMKRMVALKIIRQELLSDADTVGRFNREIEVVSALSHPNIVHAYDAGTFGQTMFLAMEFVEGIDLDRMVKKNGPLPIVNACDYIRQAALALQHAHERSLVHRDIKPSNLLVSRESGGRGSELGTPTPWGLVKLLDLGLARLRSPGKSGTRNLTMLQGNTVMMGTTDYMSPDQALDFHTADIRADIYSLGCTLYYVLTGQPPFPTGSVPEKLMKHQTAEPTLAHELRKDVPPALSAIVKKMLAKRPSDRFQTPGEVAQALMPFVMAAKGSHLKAEGTGSGIQSTSGISTRKRSGLKADSQFKSGERRKSQLKMPSQKGKTRLRTPRGLRWYFFTFVGVMVLLSALGVFGYILMRQSGTPDDAGKQAENPSHLAQGNPPTSQASTRRSLPLVGSVRAKAGAGKTFDGKEGLEFPHAADLESPNLSLETWFSLSAIPGGDDKRRWLISKNVHEGTDGHYALIIDGRKVGAYLNTGGENQAAMSTTDLLNPDNKWHHLAMVFDEALLVVYLDGQLAAAQPVNKPRKFGNGTLAIGKRPDNYDKAFFQGRLDDIRAYNRALKVEEIKTHFEQPDMPADKKEPGLVFRKVF